MDRTFHIVTCVANPIGWASRVKLARDAIANWLKEPNVHVTLVECAYGARGYELADLASDRVTHVPVRATTLVWNKENLLNLGITRLPHNARYVGTFDADVKYRSPGWARAILAALDIYPAIQPWTHTIDLGPNDEVLATHKSFAAIYHAGRPVGEPANSPYEFAHPGYAWAWTRDALDRIGGLFELGGMGSGDHHMALAIAGKADCSLPGTIDSSYSTAVKRWERHAATHINGKLGFITATLEHDFHGRKSNRGYQSRWGMFIDHAFDPFNDLKRNSFGVIEFSGEKPALERAFDRYLRSREEDVNTNT